MPPITESAWGELQDRVNTLETGQRMIATGHVQLVEQMAEITVSQRRADEQRKIYSARLDAITVDLAENSKVTREILDATRDLRDVVITAKTGGRLAKWAAPTLVAAGVSVGILKGWLLSSWEWLSK